MLRLFEAIIEQLKALFKSTHIAQGCPLVRSPGLGHEAVYANNQLTLGAHSIHLRTHAQNHLHSFLNIRILFPRQANHIVQLNMPHAYFGRNINRIAHMLLGDTLVYRCSHPLAASLGRNGHGPLPTVV